MAIGLDYTSRIDPNAIKAAGATVVCRYIAPQAWKVIHQAEYNELKAAGIQVILNWESSANDWSGGSGAGTSHGNQASAMADALGYPKGSVIIGSCDFDANATSVEPYAQAFKVALDAHGFKAGVYAPYNVLSMCQNHGYAFYWQTMSTGWANNSRQHPAANLWQKGHKTVGGQDCDWSQIINVNVSGSSGFMGTSDNIIAGWASGLEHGAGGETIAPVTWEIRHEAFEAATAASLVSIAKVLADLTTAVHGLSGGGTSTSVDLTGVKAELDTVLTNTKTIVSRLDATSKALGGL